ncbi:MAG: hypothetical protein K2Q14_00270 [Gammaproteobacteria bacterium]|nr:hypothetical protein [Gammaproteobacteria bacterium]
MLHVARHTLNQRYFGLISGLTIAVGTLTGSLIQVYIAHAIQYWSWQTCLALSALPNLSIAFLFLLPFFKTINTPLVSAKTKPIQLIPSIVQLSKQRGFILNALSGHSQYYNDYSASVGSSYSIHASIFSGIGIALTNMIITLCAAIFHVIEGFLITYYSTIKSDSNLSNAGLLHGLWIIPGLFMISDLLSQFLPKQASKNKPI